MVERAPTTMKKSEHSFEHARKLVLTAIIKLLCEQLKEFSFLIYLMRRALKDERLQLIEQLIISARAQTTNMAISVLGR